MSFGKAKRRPFPGSPTVIDNVRLFDGERLLDHMTVVVRGEMIEAVEPAATVRPPEGAVMIRGEKRTLLPGVIDAHVHLGLRRPRRVFRGGVTTARDLGWPLEAIRGLAAKLADGTRGPRLLYAGPMLTAPGGYPARAAWAPPGTAREVSSPDEARAAVRELLEGDVAVVKVALEGDGPALDTATVAAIVDEARIGGRRVTAHIGSVALLARALEAGVDELAHGLWADAPIPDETIATMARAGVVVVPTLHVHPSEARLGNVRRFVEAGGVVVYGTDMGNPPAATGIDVEELTLMRRCGMTSEAALAAATARAADHLGLADRGRVRAGLLADLILVRGDPRKNLGVLAKPLLAMRGGRPAR